MIYGRPSAARSLNVDSNVRHPVERVDEPYGAARAHKLRRTDNHYCFMKKKLDR